MSFDNFTVGQLKHMVNECKEYHNINCAKLCKEDLIREIEKYFIIRDNKLFAKGQIAPPNSPNLEGGNSKNSGYVRKMESINLKHGKFSNNSDIDPNKMKNASEYMLKKYGDDVSWVDKYDDDATLSLPPLEDIKKFIRTLKRPKKPKRKSNNKNNNDNDYSWVNDYDDDITTTTVQQPAPVNGPLFEKDEIVDFDVSKAKKPKPKPVKKGEPKPLTEVEEDRIERIAREKHHKEMQQRQALLQSLESLKNEVLDWKKELDKEDNDYNKLLKELQSNKLMRKQVKEVKREEMIQQHHQRKNNIKQLHPNIYKYLKDNKLKEDFNIIHKHIRTQITNI